MDYLLYKDRNVVGIIVQVDVLMRVDQLKKLWKCSTLLIRVPDEDAKLAGPITIRTMSWTNFQVNYDFKWPLLILPLVWLIGLALPPSLAGAMANRLLNPDV